jgi:hypothetical protein
MSQPAVNIREIDGALGILPAGEKIHAVAGVCTAAGATANVPIAFGRTVDLIAYASGGPAVEAACHYIDTYKRPVLLVPTGKTTAGLPGTLVTTGKLGTSIVTITGVPDDDYEPQFKVIVGGTIAVAGITYQWSLDGGRTWSATLALGTANTFSFPGAGSLGLAFAAGTLLAGDIVTSRTTAPQWTAAELGAACDALAATTQSWGILQVVGPIDSAAFDMLETKFSGLSTAGKPKAWIGNTRMPNVGETEAAYKTAVDTIFSAKATVYGSLCSGAVKLTSAVTGRKYKRPVSFSVAARENSVSEEVNTADVNLGVLPGVSIRDANGNADEHDETLNPGLDDSRFTVLRTIDGYPGVYINRPRIFSAPGSDFFIMPHRRVMNLAREGLRLYFIKRLNKSVLVNRTTGFILETEALEIEAGADAVLRALLMAKPKASGGGFSQGRFVQISRTDNLISTKTMTGQGRIVPLAYPEFINFDLGFYNPALQVVPT